MVTVGNIKNCPTQPGRNLGNNASTVKRIRLAFVSDVQLLQQLAGKKTFFESEIRRKVKRLQEVAEISLQTGAGQLA